ncbi:MAG TPA: extracellular solute-binding protein [Steroidobacteraceae bacterium]|nr:extracellular solute-binding protein [Steroidobacteraceae bacterium]
MRQRKSSASCAAGWTSRLLAACAVSLLAAAPSPAADRAKTLNLYAWAEYFPPALIDAFQRETGIHVNYSVLDSPETAETILSVGNSNYDIVTMNAAPELAREIPHGFWRKLDPAAIPNARNADPQVMQLLRAADPENRHAIPWMWGTTGILYNRDKIQAIMRNAPIDSLDMVLKKEIAQKFASCGIGMLDSWGDILPMVSRYIGQPRLSADGRELDAVMAKLQEIQRYVRHISSSGYYQQLAEGELCLAIGYSGDAMVARRMVEESHGNVHVDYAFAREMVPFYIDSMVIPADSPNPAAAQAFINFAMRPEISASVTRFIGFATANAAAVALLEPAVRSNEIIYPPPEVRRRFELQRVYTPEEHRAFTRAWLAFKSGL